MRPASSQRSTVDANARNFYVVLHHASKVLLVVSIAALVALTFVIAYFSFNPEQLTLGEAQWAVAAVAWLLLIFAPPRIYDLSTRLEDKAGQAS